MKSSMYRSKSDRQRWGVFCNREGYLVPPVAVSVATKFLRERIRYGERDQLLWSGTTRNQKGCFPLPALKSPPWGEGFNWPQAGDIVVMRYTPSLFWSPGVVTVLTGQMSCAAQAASAIHQMTDYPTDVSKPLWRPGPIVTDAPTISHAAVLSERHLAAVRKHHDAVLAPALAAGRAVLCVGAWWTSGLCEVDSADLVSAFAYAWPSVTRVLTIRYTGGVPTSLVPTCVYDDTGTLVTVGPGGPGELQAATSGALHRMGALRWTWQRPGLAGSPR
jgi:hypothetical protein